MKITIWSIMAAVEFPLGVFYIALLDPMCFVCGMAFIAFGVIAVLEHRDAVR